MTTSRQQERAEGRNREEPRRGAPTHNPVTPTRPVVVERKQFYPSLTVNLKTFINAGLYRCVIFIANPEELQYDSQLFNIVKRKIGGNCEDIMFLGWWNVCGMKEFKSCLNSKRQTLTNTLKGLVKKQFGKAKKLKAEHQEAAYPPKPEELFSVLEQEEGRTIVAGMRELQGMKYLDFLKDYGKAVYGKDFGGYSKSKSLGRFFPTCMEAFLLVAYRNGYERWKASALNEGWGDKDDRLPKYEFTSEAKGAKTCQGWNKEGVGLYDNLFDKLTHQRGDNDAARLFENNFILRCARRSLDNGEEMHRNDLDSLEMYEV